MNILCFKMCPTIATCSRVAQAGCVNLITLFVINIFASRVLMLISYTFSSAFLVYTCKLTYVGVKQVI